MFFCPDCNNILDISKNTSNASSSSSNVDNSNINTGVYFLCSNCGYYEDIKPGTKIYSKTSAEIAQVRGQGTENYDDLIHSDIMPRTRRYVCVNPDCESHNDPTKREAVFFTMNNTYKKRYVCVTCKASF
jgi:hypothetical protein